MGLQHVTYKTDQVKIREIKTGFFFLGCPFHNQVLGFGCPNSTFGCLNKNVTKKLQTDQYD